LSGCRESGIRQPCHIHDSPKRPITIQDVFHTAGFTYGLFGDTPVDKDYQRANLQEGTDADAVFRGGANGKIDSGENGVLTSGEFGWSGAASTNFLVDPKEDLVVIGDSTGALNMLSRRVKHRQ
jgi:hypothetical protein